MSTFEGRVEELPNVLIDNFWSCESHTCFFLSHCHSDHMGGLDKYFSNICNNAECNNFIYCSPISRLILLSKFKNSSEKSIKEIVSTTVITVPGNDIAPSYQITVTPIPAGHCIGSIMFLFETLNSTSLYTGDFRFLKNDISKLKSLHNGNKVKFIDKVYLDSTFLSEAYWNFPFRSEVVSEVIKVTQNWICQSPNHNVLLVTSALFGYEFIFTELAKKLKYKIHVKDELYDLFCNIPEVGCFLTKSCKSTKIHVIYAFGQKCISFYHEKLLRIKLSAQWYKSPKGASQEKIWKQISDRYIVMCYSTHCSCSELTDFLNYLQPGNIEPCSIAVGSTEYDTKAYIQHLRDSWRNTTQDENSEPNKPDFSLEKNYKFKLKFLENTRPVEFEDFWETSP